MIRINLLGQAKSKNKRGAPTSTAVMEVGDPGSPKMKVLVVLVLAGVLNVGYWYRLDVVKRDIAAQKQVAGQKNRELANVKTRELELPRQGQNINTPRDGI